MLPLLQLGPQFLAALAWMAMTMSAMAESCMKVLAEMVETPDVQPRGDEAMVPFRSSLSRKGITKRLVRQYLQRAGTIEDLVGQHQTSYEEVVGLCD